MWLIVDLNRIMINNKLHDEYDDKALENHTSYKPFRACFRACNNSVIKAL